MLNDLRLALRALRRAPAFAVATALTLALGLGATTALFTAVRGILLRPLPYARPGQLVQLWAVTDRGDHAQVTEPDAADLRDGLRSASAVARFQGWLPTVLGGGEPARVPAALVSGDFFAVMGARPVVGRAFLAEERRPGAAPAVVVGDALWRRLLGAERDLGRLTLTVDGKPAQVVGVMPPGFDFPRRAELWAPAELYPPNTSRTAHNWNVVARLRDGADAPTLQREASALVRGLRARFGSDMSTRDARVVLLRDELVGRARAPLVLLFSAAGALLLVAATNVGTLLVARAEARRRELGVRLAVGATGRHLVRQQVAESLVLAVAGGGAGVLVALAGAGLIARLGPDALDGVVPRAEAVRVDAGVLAFAVAAALAVALAMGVAAGWRAVRAGAAAVGGAGGGLAGRERAGTGGRAAARTRGTLVAAQVALTAVLLTGAGLLARAFVRLAGEDLGFRADGALAVQVAFPDAPDAAADLRVRRTADAVVERLRALPGVRAAGGVTSLPVWGGADGNGTFVVQSRPDEIQSIADFVRLSKDPARTGNAEYRRATDGYFEAMRIPLVRGRTFSAADAAGAPPVAVITASVARARFAGREPIGQLIQFGNMDGDTRPLTVVGVVGDVRESLGGDPEPAVYALVRQRPAPPAVTAVLAPVPGGPPLDRPAALAAARRAVREVDPTLPVRVRPVEEVFARALAARRYALVLAAAFALAALALAATGVFGVVAHVSAAQRRELGVRVALGARAADVRRFVLGRGLAPAALGLAAGLVAALAAGRLLAAQLYGVRPADPATFAGVAAALGAVALAAAWGPARRAARADPAAVLRAE